MLLAHGLHYAVDLTKLLMLNVLGLMVIKMDGGFKRIALVRTFALIHQLHQQPTRYVIPIFRLGGGRLRMKRATGKTSHLIIDFR